MRRGCVSLGEIKCDSCKRTVAVADRYLITDEVTDENGKRKTVRYCLKCCEEKELIGYRHEKEEKVLTFFPPDEKAIELPPMDKLPEEKIGEPAGFKLTEPVEEEEKEEETNEEEESEDEEEKE